MDGGSWALLGLLRDHRGAIEYDFRSRFGIGLGVIGRDMSLAEAARHVRRLGNDPSSALAAELGGWDYPVSRVELLLMDLWDVAAPHTYKKPKPYPRPWKNPGQVSRRGNAAGRTAAEVTALLRVVTESPSA